LSKRKKLLLMTDDLAIYVENIKESAATTRNFMGWISSDSKAAGYKVNIVKSIVFLYTSNELVEFETNNTLPFILTPKNHILRYKSNKICMWKAEKTLMKYIYEELNKWRAGPCFWWENNTVKFWPIWSIDST
jgi:hypothetical protein